MGNHHGVAIPDDQMSSRSHKHQGRLREFALRRGHRMWGNRTPENKADKNKANARRRRRDREVVAEQWQGRVVKDAY